MINNGVTIGVVKQASGGTGEIPGLSDVLAVSNRKLKYIENVEEYSFLTSDETKELILMGVPETPITLILSTNVLPLGSELIINAYQTSGILDYGDSEVVYAYDGQFLQQGDATIEIPFGSKCTIRNVEGEDFFFVIIDNVNSNNTKLISNDYSAINNDELIINANCSISDVQNPVDGTNFNFTIVSGNATVGGVVYNQVGKTYKRIYNAGNWITYIEVASINGIEETGDGDFIIQDENDNVAFKIFPNGEVEFSKATTTTKNLFSSPVKITGKKIAILGDSISTTNGGGTGIAEVDTYAGLLALNNNCEIFRNAVAGTNIAADFTADARVNSLNSIFQPDVILVFGGVNDFLEDTPLGVFGDTTTSTFYGGLDVLCKKLLTRYPNTKIFFMTPLHHRYTTAGGLIPEFNGTNFMTEFVDAIEKVCKRFGIPIINTNQNSGITCYNINTLSSDSIHVRETGHLMLYNTIINETNFLL